MRPGQTMVAVQVKAGTEEFTTVETNLKATAQNMINSVVKVHNFYCDIYCWAFASTALTPSFIFSHSVLMYACPQFSST